MGRLYNTCTTRYGMVKIKFHPAVSPMKRGNPGVKGHINIRQSFRDEALFFCACFSARRCIKICKNQKYFPIYLRISKIICNFAAQNVITNTMPKYF